MDGKICSKCKEFKSYSEFYKDKRNKDGYTFQCKQCKKEYDKQHHKKYYNSHKEERREYQKQYDNSHKEEIKEKSKQYRESHKELLKDYKKQYLQDIKDKNIMMISELIKNIEKYDIINKHNIPIYGYIYKIENIKTGHIYIGQTIRPLTQRYNSNIIIDGWINERIGKNTQKFKNELINIDDFKISELLDVGICKYHLDKLEAYYINLYDSYNNGYNNNNGNHKTDDGLEEFMKILEKYNINESELIKGA